ncbi:MAG: DUF131 domain-containing protein [Archaeoglobaceae archaeon]|nr:DUF131 domain-containing protein [Archaeoglobaceae archaeon]
MIEFIGFLLMFIGIILILSAFIGEKSVVQRQQGGPEFKNGEKKYGGIVLIGPIPVVFGDVKLAILAMILAIVLMLLSILLLMGWFG